MHKPPGEQARAAEIIPAIVTELKPWKLPLRVMDDFSPPKTFWVGAPLQGPVNPDRTFPLGSFWFDASGVWDAAIVEDGRLIATPKDEQAIAWAVKKHQAKLENEATAELCEQIALLASITPAFLTRDKIRATRADAREIAATTKKLQAQIKRASPELRLWMKIDERGSWQGPLPAGQVGIPRLQVELEHFRGVCTAAAAAQPLNDPLKQLCARIAVNLILKYSTKQPTGGRKGALRSIAGQLFEAATGVEDADFARACRDAIREWKRALA